MRIDYVTELDKIEDKNLTSDENNVVTSSYFIKYILDADANKAM